MPTLKPFDKLEDAPEGLRPFLIENGGKFVPDYDIEVDPRLAPLKSAFERVKLENSTRGTKLKTFEDLGFTPEQIVELKTAADAKGAKTKSDKDVEAQIAEATQKAAQRIAELEKSVGEKDGTIDHLVRRSGAAAELAAKKANAELLMPHVLERTETKLGPDGKPVVVVIDPVTRAPRLKDHLGNPMTLADLVAEMEGDTKFAAAFEGKLPSGSGAKTETGKGGSVTKIPKGDNAAFLANLDGIAAGTVVVE
jgi:hypothetical protein